MVLRCSGCKKMLPEGAFNIDTSRKRGYQRTCKACYDKYRRDNIDRIRIVKREWKYRTERATPLHENKDCASYLGVHVAERVLAKTFENVKRMPFGNKGYDFICGRGYKIDVKAATRRRYKTCLVDSWMFHIYKNTTADYFLCIAFDNRVDLTPEHLWLIPGNVLNTKQGTAISESTLGKWSKYEQPLEKVTNCCTMLKGEVV